MDNMLLDKIQIPGVTLKVRDREQYMNASLDVRAKHLAKVEMAARKAQESSEYDEAKAMEDFYSKGNKVD